MTQSKGREYFFLMLGFAIIGGTGWLFFKPLFFFRTLGSFEKDVAVAIVAGCATVLAAC